MLNNSAFEYLLEGRWKEATPIFEQAAELFKKTGILFEHANSRANYWICRFESEDLQDMEEIQNELESLRKVLNKKGLWQTRKPLILLAKIEQRRGNIRGAVKLVEQAIESAKGSNTQYPELDRRYLEDLKRKMDSRMK